MIRKLVAVTAIVCLAAGAVNADVDQKLPQYKPGSGVSGNIKSVGSDTMNNLMTFWAEQFKKYYPSVQIEIEGKGSSTAPPALIEGSSAFGPMSRKMKSKELDAFVRRSSATSATHLAHVARHARRLRTQGQPDRQEP